MNKFDISLDGYDELSCEKIRGKGVYNKVVEIVKKLKDEGAEDISISMVDMHYSKKMRDKFKELNQKLKTKPIIRALSPVGRAVSLESKLEYLDKLYTPRELEQEEQSSICAGFRGTNCGAFRNQFFVNYNGDIYPCGLLIKDEYKLGNINQMRPDRYLTNHESSNLNNVLGLEPDKIEKCKDCEVNFFCGDVCKKWI